MKLFSFLVLSTLILFSACKNKTAKTTSVVSKTEKTVETSKAKAATVNHNPLNKKEITKNMVKFKGGSFTMGNNNGTPKEAPEHPEKVDAFYLDKTPVTVSEFRQFIKDTGHKTDADKFGDSMVFNFETGQWALVPGCNWEYPFGPNGGKAKNNHPVTHVSWNDAIAYARWAGKRLPTEKEWEYAAKNGGKSIAYPWGNDLKVDGKWMCNAFQGTIQQPALDDGFLYTSPVGAFGTHQSGLTDMAGNVWQWLEDTYAPYQGNTEATPKNEDLKCIRGGSFMFDNAGNESFTTTFRSSNTSESSLYNTGFRCALSAE